jgi:hypothetical protein
MSNAEELIDDLLKAGAKVTAADGCLVVRAGARAVPGILVQRLREAKAEVLATLCPQWWSRQFVIRTIDRALGGARSYDDAARLAWGELECRWHWLYGDRVAEWRCAGCGKLISGLPSLDLQDGNRVHFDQVDCLIGYGDRWRGEASRALVAMGLQRPAGVNHDD